MTVVFLNCGCSTEFGKSNRDLRDLQDKYSRGTHYKKEKSFRLVKILCSSIIMNLSNNSFVYLSI